MRILPLDKSPRSRVTNPPALAAIARNRVRLRNVPRSSVTNPTALAAIARNRPATDETMGDIWSQITGALSPIFGGVGGSVTGQVQPTATGQVGGSVGGVNVGGSVVGTVQPNAREVVIEVKGSPNDGLFYNESEWIKMVLTARGWNITNIGQVSSPGITGGGGVWRLTAMVGKQYSDSQIVTNARNHLTAKGMTVTGVAIVQASAATYVSGNVDSSGGDGANASGVSSMLAGAALGLGVSTTVLMIGGAAVAVLLLRRR